MVTRLDLLARSTRDLLNILDTIAKAGAGFKSLADAWADTTTAHGRLMLTVLGGLAEFERALIIARTGDGRVRAKARGVRFGRPPALTSHQRQEAIQRLAEGATQADLARTYGVSQATISRLQPLPFERRKRGRVKRRRHRPDRRRSIGWGVLSPLFECTYACPRAPLPKLRFFDDMERAGPEHLPVIEPLNEH